MTESTGQIGQRGRFRHPEAERLPLLFDALLCHEIARLVVPVPVSPVVPN
jgi:hypothetical protein